MKLPEFKSWVSLKYLIFPTSILFYSLGFASKWVAGWGLIKNTYMPIYSYMSKGHWALCLILRRK